MARAWLTGVAKVLSTGRMRSNFCSLPCASLQVSRIPFEYFAGGYFDRSVTPHRLRVSPMQLVMDAVTATSQFDVFSTSAAGIVPSIM